MSEDKQKIEDPLIIRGIYEHYKGGRYLVLYEAINTEDEMASVVYQNLESKEVFVRPKTIFASEVEKNGEKIKRFTFISPLEEDDAESRYKRAVADYQNLLKNTAREKAEFYNFALSNFLEELLPIYDNLKMSVSTLSVEEKNSPWVKGVEYVLKQFKDFLEDKDVQEIKTVGENFDHNTMEAISGQGEKVVKELSAGYKLKDKVLRPAKVVVA